ncbi:MAG: PAS domain S-box protein [Comamonadaceae bacterium]|nr:MAG: PAS domain S-box protein [Comamonadaceae bacterium]
MRCLATVMQTLMRLLTFAACVAAPLGATAQDLTLKVAGEGSYVLSRHLSWLEDKSRQLGIEDIRAAAAQARFNPVAQGGPGANFGLTTSAIWLKAGLDVDAAGAAGWLVEIAYPPLDRVDVYSQDAAGHWVRQAGGDALPFASRAIPHRNHVMAVLLKPGANTLYLRIESQGTVSAPVKLWRPAALWAHDQAEYAALALYFGLLFGLLAYNLLLFFSVRDVNYLIYVAFAGSMALVQGALTGLAGQFVWPGLPWWNGVSPPASMAIAAVFGVWFARAFLASAREMPRLDLALKVITAGWALTIVAALALPYTVSSWMVTVLAVVTVSLLVAAGVVSVRRGHPGARYFLTAWAVLLTGVVTLALHNTGLVPSNRFTANALLIGSALEMVLLSFALADRINVSRAEKEQAQARIAAEHAMVEKLSESQERYRAVLEEREIVLENSLVGIAFLSPSGRFKWANQAMFQIFGVPRSEQTFDSLEPFYPSRAAYLMTGGEVAGAISRGEVFEVELQMRKLDGTVIWVALSGKAVSVSDLSQGTVWAIMDITRRKHLEDELQRTSSEREAILNTALVGMVMSVARRHVWVNHKFAEMLGQKREDLIGQTSAYIHVSVEEWERFGVLAREMLVRNNSYIDERQFRRKNGDTFWVQMAGSCIEPHNPDSGVIWTFLDITGRRRSEQETREALEQQKALNELRTRFVAMTSHEFRTPLAGILSAEEVLRHYGDRLPAEEKLEVLDSIASGVQRMSRMMDRVLLLGKAEAHMLEFAPAPLDLRALCRDLVAEARTQGPQPGCDVALEVASNVEPGEYDEKLLRHIFGNLLSNALKYSPQGGKVRFRVYLSQGQVVFEVADQGIGIPEEEIAHLFESFHRASNVGSIQGTGLGLAIVKNAVETHGGTIDVKSVVGEGTTFVVRLEAPKLR